MVAPVHTHPGHPATHGGRDTAAHVCHGVRSPATQQQRPSLGVGTEADPRHNAAGRTTLSVRACLLAFVAVGACITSCPGNLEVTTLTAITAREDRAIGLWQPLCRFLYPMHWRGLVLHGSCTCSCAEHTCLGHSQTNAGPHVPAGFGPRPPRHASLHWEPWGVPNPNPNPNPDPGHCQKFKWGPGEPTCVSRTCLTSSGCWQNFARWGWGGASARSECKP